MFNRKSIYALNKKDPNAIVYQIYPVRIRHWLSSNSRALLILTFL